MPGEDEHKNEHQTTPAKDEHGGDPFVKEETHVDAHEEDEKNEALEKDAEAKVKKAAAKLDHEEQEKVEKEEKAEKSAAKASEDAVNASKAASGGAAQQYSVSVPYSGTSLQMGSAAGGAGASLVTLGATFLDSLGTTTVQAKATMLIQTNANMKALSASGTKVHSGAKIEVYAGGGEAPGAAGTGKPGTPTPGEEPGATAEKVVAATTGALEVAEGATEWHEGNKLGAMASFAKGAGELGEAAGLPGGLNKGLGIAGSFASAVSNAGKALDGDPGAMVATLQAVIDTGGKASSAAGGGGGSDLDMQATGNIKMTTPKKIQGTAMNNIEFKTSTKFAVAAALVTDIKTLKFGLFALAKTGITTGIFKASALGKYTVEVGGIYSLDAKGGIKVETAGMYEVEAGVSIDLKAEGPMKLEAEGGAEIDGKSKVEIKAADVTIKGKTKVEGELTVDKEAMFEENVGVKGEFRVSKDAFFNGQSTIVNSSVFKAKGHDVKLA